MTPPTARDIAAALIACPSVTPADAGALDHLQGLLTKAGFACHRLPFSSPGMPEIDNLFARIGDGAPHLCLAGHTDVVPPGDDALWTHPPFAAEVHDGTLYGRGAVDMKGGLAGMVAAALAYLDGNALTGSLSFLVTGDEEGPAVNGTVKVLKWMAENGHTPDHCAVGEPTNPAAMGDEIKIGRRGSLSGKIAVTGTQGHVAYPHLARNPVPPLLEVLSAFAGERLDDGTDHFAPSNLEITSVDVGNPADNVIPATARAAFNVRFNDTHTGDRLKARLAGLANAALEGSGVSYDLDMVSSGDAFVTEPGPLVGVMQQAIAAECGRTPGLSTSGGTSDARFIKDYCPVFEFGLVNTTIHQADERVPLADLDTLTRVYRRFIAGYFETFAKT